MNPIKAVREMKETEAPKEEKVPEEKVPKVETLPGEKTKDHLEILKDIDDKNCEFRFYLGWYIDRCDCFLKDFEKCLKIASISVI